ncbi:MAG: hypothetical protein B6I38_11555 [Anaerolineaceae bacterium 4572_5.1]|nr:MAG: hypothetical protein B6I38_11555 [Anaerolineaceae bacterium 4572_5.1]
MTIQITIIGLGQIGASAGLALSDYEDDILRVGHDKDPLVARKAKQEGMIDKMTLTLSNAVQDADAVLLAIPAHEIRPTLEHIAQDLKEDAIVIDTAPMKRVVEKWADELLPPKRYYVGLAPVINSDYLQEFGFGIEAARKDLFDEMLMALITGPKASTQAVNFATSFIKLLGAKTLFVGAAEMDGLMTTTHVMPHLVAAALVSAAVTKPGWRDAQKFAGRAFAQVSEPIGLSGSPEALASMTIHNGDNAERIIDDVIYALQNMQQAIREKDEEALDEYLQEAYKSRRRWWVDREDGEWSDTKASGEVSKPERGSLFKRLLGFDDSRRKRANDD